MKVISVYNRYLSRGGEDEVFESEAKLLADHGCTVSLVSERLEVPESFTKRLPLAIDAVWSRKWYREFENLICSSEPDVIHVHNVFPLISPSIYHACYAAKVPVVQTLHNYRLTCPGKILYRGGRVCEECLGRSPWRGVLHGCYRDSRAATAATALMLSVHRWLGTWSKMVDCYIALTEFARAKFIEGGLPAEKIVVKPNFVYPDPMAVAAMSPSPNIRDHLAGETPALQGEDCSGTLRARNMHGDHRSPLQGEFALFIGRLAEEKGVRTLVAAWKRLGNGIPLEIVGDGPLRPELEKTASCLGLSSVSFTGHLTPEHLAPILKSARFLVFPSEWYEGMPRTIIEAFACGVPVIASRLGAMQEIVEDGRTGLHFIPGDADDLAAKVEWAWTHPNEMQEMGRAARAEYEFKYTAERNYQMLMDVYERVLGSRR